MLTDAASDNELFAAIAVGDEQAFAILYRRYVPKLLPMVSKYIKAEGKVDEIIQRIFLNLWLTRDRLPVVEIPRAWIFRVAANVCFTDIKRTVSERKALGEIGRRQSAVQQDDVQQLAETTELASLVKQAIEKLPAQRQRIYLLSREEGMSYKEIAEELGISANTVRNTIAASLESIREFLKEQGYSIPIAIILTLFY